MLFSKQMKTRDGLLLSICDEELLGSVYREGKMVIDLVKYRSFYEGERVKEGSASLIKAVKSAASINAVGERSIGLLKKAGFDTLSAKRVGGVPHLHVYRL